MKLGNSIITATYLSRPNRFTVLAKQNSKTIRCHLPNPGRLKELLKQNAAIALDHRLDPRRKTSYEVVAAKAGGVWVSLDSQLPNKLILHALRVGELPEFLGYSRILPESRFRNSRFDFLLQSNTRKCFLEVKSCTLVENKTAFFPDAPTTRGRRHILDLVQAKRKGYRACVLFVIQRADAKVFRPNRVTDTPFADALVMAEKAGVEIYARKCLAEGFQIALGGRVPILL
jgi:sugar fermentation stimulation protein A